MRLILVFLTILITSSASAKTVPLVEVAAGWEEGQYFHWAAGLAGRTKRARLLVQPTNGSAQSVSHLAAGRVGLAVAQGDVVWHARYNSGRVPKDENLVAIGTLFEEMVHVVVLTSSEMSTLADLSGRRIGVGAVGSGSLYNALDVLSAAEVTDAQLDFTSAFLLDRMLEGQLDAAIVTARVPFLPVIEDERFKLISIPAGLLDDAPYYHLSEFPSQYGTGTSIYIPSLLVGHANLPDRVVTELIELAGLDPVGVTVPLHPAADKFYTRRGAVISLVESKYLPPDLPQLPAVFEWSNRTEDGLEQRNLTTNQVVTEAIKRDPVLKSLVLHQRRSALAVDQVKTNFSPTMSIASGGNGLNGESGASSGWTNDIAMSVWAPTGTTVSSRVGMSSSNLDGAETWGSETSLSVSQELLDGAGMGANLSTLERARLDAAIAKIDTHASAVGLVSDVLTKFYDLNERHERLGLRRDQVDFARRHLNRVRAKTSIGNEHALAFQEANHSKLLAEKELLGEQRLLLDAEDTLLDYMQAHFGYHIVPMLDADAMNLREVAPLTELTRVALSRRDEIRRQSALLHKARLAKTAAVNAALPSVSANGSVGRMTDGSSGSAFGATKGLFSGSATGLWSLGLTVHHTLGGGVDPIELERVTLNVKVEALALEELVERVKREVRAASRALETVKKQRDVAIAAREIADEKLGLAVEAFRRGEADSFKVITYQDDYLNARLEVVAATADYLTARVTLDRAMGVILDPYLALFQRVSE